MYNNINDEKERERERERERELCGIQWGYPIHKEVYSLANNAITHFNWEKFITRAKNLGDEMNIIGIITTTKDLAWRCTCILSQTYNNLVIALNMQVKGPNLNFEYLDHVLL